MTDKMKALAERDPHDLVFVGPARSLKMLQSTLWPDVDWRTLTSASPGNPERLLGHDRDRTLVVVDEILWSRSEQATVVATLAARFESSVWVDTKALP